MLGHCFSLSGKGILQSQYHILLMSIRWQAYLSNFQHSKSLLDYQIKLTYLVTAKRLNRDSLWAPIAGLVGFVTNFERIAISHLETFQFLQRNNSVIFFAKSWKFVKLTYLQCLWSYKHATVVIYHWSRLMIKRSWARIPASDAKYILHKYLQYIKLYCC